MSIRKRYQYSNPYKSIKKRKFEDIDDDDDDIEDDNITDNNGGGKTLPKLLDMLQRKKVYDIDNHIFFRTDVTDESIDMLGKLITIKNREFDILQKNCPQATLTPNPLYLHITTNGGSLYAGFMAVDMIERSKIPINTVVEGYVASAGSLMSVVGKKRYMAPNAAMLIHQLSSSAKGKFDELEDDHENNKILMKRLKDIYISHSHDKLGKKKLGELLKHDKDWFFDTCFQYGLVDELYKEDLEKEKSS